MSSSQGKELTDWRLRERLSQEAAGKALGPHLSPPNHFGVSQTTWASWELGTKTPGLAHAFGIERMTDGLVRAEAWLHRRRRKRRGARSGKAA